MRQCYEVLRQWSLHQRPGPGNTANTGHNSGYSMLSTICRSLHIIVFRVHCQTLVRIITVLNIINGSIDVNRKKKFYWKVVKSWAVDVYRNVWVECSLLLVEELLHAAFQLCDWSRVRTLTAELASHWLIY